jgi:hypothetical protein
VQLSPHISYCSAFVHTLRLGLKSLAGAQFYRAVEEAPSARRLY